MAAQPKVIQIGVPITLTNGIVYAMPTRLCQYYVNSTTANLQANIVNSTTGWQTISTANLTGTLAAAFVKTTDSGGLPIVLKAN
jgi:hypothetical protein